LSLLIQSREALPVADSGLRTRPAADQPTLQKHGIGLALPVRNPIALAVPKALVETG